VYTGRDIFIFFFLICVLSYYFFPFFPTVPQQKNGFDHGLYICQYAFGIFKIRQQIISKNDILIINNNKYFQFGQRHINQFQKQLGKLLDSQVYRSGSLSKGKSLWQEPYMDDVTSNTKRPVKDNAVSDVTVRKV
jgi:hypothetical protein